MARISLRKRQNQFFDVLTDMPTVLTARMINPGGSGVYLTRGLVASTLSSGAYQVTQLSAAGPVESKGWRRRPQRVWLRNPEAEVRREEAAGAVIAPGWPERGRGGSEGCSRLERLNTATRIAGGEDAEQIG